jgi:hypothetical protein
MTTTNSTPAAELIPVLRNPRLAKSLPIVAGITPNDDEQRIIEKWRGTTPHGRELIRKKLWVLQREMLGALFDKPWSKIVSMFPADLFARALSAQDTEVLECICGHLTRTHQWPAFQTSVEQAAEVFESIKWWSNYSGYSMAVEFFNRAINIVPPTRHLVAREPLAPNILGRVLPNLPQGEQC